MTSVVPFAKGVMLASLVFLAGYQVTLPPSDAAMETMFRQNQTEFDQLRQLITEDSSAGIVLSVSEDRTDPEFKEAARRGLSEGRLENYRRLLRRLHLKGVGRDGDDVTFQAGAEGWLMKAIYKGYLFTKDKPQHIEETLERAATCGNLLVKPLQGYWYLYYFRDCTDGPRAIGDKPAVPTPTPVTRQ